MVKKITGKIWNKLDFIKVKIFCALKDVTDKVKKKKNNLYNWRRYFEIIYLIKF